MASALEAERRKAGRRISRGATRHAFSLIELLVAISVMVVLASIATPVVISSAREHGFRFALGQIVSAIGAARAEAMKDGTCVELVFEPGVKRGAVAVSAWSPRVGTEAASDTAEPLGPVARQSHVGLRRLIVLSPGIKLSQAAASASHMPESEDRSDVEQAATSLLILLPDGSALRPTTIEVADGFGRTAAIRVGRWSSPVVAAGSAPRSESSRTDEQESITAVPEG